MFITLHDKGNEVIIRVEAIDCIYRNEERVHSSIVVTQLSVVPVDESVNQIKEMLMPEDTWTVRDPVEEPYAVWEEVSFSPATGAPLYRCSKCGNETYYPFDICPVCLSRMEKRYK